MGIGLSGELIAFLDEVQPIIVGTLRSDRTVQMNPAWYERHGDEIWLNAASSRAWGRRLEQGSSVTLLVLSPTDPFGGHRSRLA